LSPSQLLLMLDGDTTRDVQVEVGEHSIVLKQQLDEGQLAPIFDDEWTASMVRKHPLTTDGNLIFLLCCLPLGMGSVICAVMLP
jgi:hypothetical protein